MTTKIEFGQDYHDSLSPMTTEEPMLEACPFCGGEGYVEHSESSAGGCRRIVCEECEAQTGPWYSTRAEAIAAWNTRVFRTPPVDQDELPNVGGNSGSREPGLASRPGPAGFDPGRKEELAPILYVADECDTVEEALLNIDRVRKFMAEGRDAKHDGDCTHQCHTCLRCLTEGYIRQAEIVLALSGAGDVREALAWALPLAERCQDDWRLLRIQNGHTDLRGTNSKGEPVVGLRQEEIDARDNARAVLAALSTDTGSGG